jgi:hypothetical protein
MDELKKAKEKDKPRIEQQMEQAKESIESIMDCEEVDPHTEWSIKAHVLTGHYEAD